jgi:CubicO group peptidase (beta-lactamase class C family)
MVILHQGFGSVIRQFDGVAGKSLLDYSYGNGNLCRLASEIGMEVAGIEPDEAARKQASTKISNNEVFAHLSGLQRAHPNCQFDQICLSESIQHLRNPWTAAIRLVRSGTNWDFNVLGSIFELQLHSKIGVEFHDQIAAAIPMQEFRVEDLYYLRATLKIAAVEASIHPMYHFRLTARDLARFGYLYLHHGNWNGTQIVPSDWVEESTRAYSVTGWRGGERGAEQSQTDQQDRFFATASRAKTTRVAGQKAPGGARQ